VTPCSSIPDAVTAAAARLAPASVTSVAEVPKGGNSRVFKVTTAAGAFALKQYPAADRRDRQGAEARALAFLARAGIGRVPRLIAADEEARVSLLSWVEGAAVTQLSEADIAQFAQFQIDLDRAIDAPARQGIGPAAEACVSGTRILSHIGARCGALTAFGEQVPEVGAFLQTRFFPALTAAKERARGIYHELGLDFAADRPLAAQTLIASDFGAHNALRDADGKLAFLDFEYFGWDDPLTSIANFVLHPAMQLTASQRAVYRDAILGHFGPVHAQRLSAVLPLFALRWCAIVLSDLLPERLEHRNRPAPVGGPEGFRRRQLAAAGRLLDLIESA
jgi:hypothetical protein